MYSFILFIHVIVCIALLTLVLIQRSKSSDMGASFGAGGGASATMFGAAGATSFLVKMTGVFGLLFFATSLTVGVMSAHLVQKNTQDNTILTAAEQASKAAGPAKAAPAIPEGPAPSDETN